MVGFDGGTEREYSLDDTIVGTINSNLTASADVTQAARLNRNVNVCFIGTKKAGEFNLPFDRAYPWLFLPNPHGKPNSDVLVPWINGTTLVNGRQSQWIVDSGIDMSMDEFSKYEAPFQYVLDTVKPDRDRNKEKRTRENWWRFKRVAPDMRDAVSRIPRYVATVRHAKHRIFAWVDRSIMCDDGIYLFAAPDDYFFGVLHSYAHEVWARSQGTQVRDRESGFRYTPTTCFETFAFPESTDEQRTAISEAAAELDRLRNNWLNPPEWTRTDVLEFPGSTNGPWARFIDPATLSCVSAGDHDEVKVGTVHYPRLVPRDADTARELKKRTLTNLYNERPTWLALAHDRLDAAVSAAYGWTADLTDEQILERLLELNLANAE